MLCLPSALVGLSKTAFLGYNKHRERAARFALCVCYYLKLDGLRLHCAEIYGPQFAAKGCAVAGEHLQGLVHLHAAHNAGRGAYDGFRRQGCLQQGFLGEEVAVTARRGAVVEHGSLAREAADGTIYIGHGVAAAGIVNQEARGKVVAAVNHGIVAGHHVGVVFCKASDDGLYLHLAVKPAQAARGALGLRLSHFVLAIKHLTVKI